MTESDHPLRPVVKKWQALIARTEEHRRKVWGETASVCRRFYTDAYDFAYKAGDGKGTPLGFAVGRGVRAPDFQMTLNKAAELVALFGPSLYAANPYRNVAPRRPFLTPDMLAPAYGPAAGAVEAAMRQSYDSDRLVAGLQATLLNYLPGQFDLKGQSRLAIDEAIITGRGVLWHDLKRPGPSSRYFVPCHRFGSADDLGLDPDADQVAEATFCFETVEGPVWQVEREFRLRRGALKSYARGESVGRQASVETSAEGVYRRKEGKTADVIRYHKVYSKCGLGHELSGPSEDPIATKGEEAVRKGAERFGDEVYLVIADGCPWPLNLPPEEEREDGAGYTEDEVFDRTRWPIPFYEDADGWPFSHLDFYPLVKSVWPMAHLKPVLSLLMFLNWGYSLLMGRIRYSSRTLLFVADHLNSEIVDQIENGGDLEIVRYKEGLLKELGEVIKQWQHEPVPIDLYNILDRVSREFDRASGLTDLVYGMTGTQIRSATEAQARQAATNVRPEAMADCVEDWQTVVARKEAMMLRWRMSPEAVSAQVGETAASPGGVGVIGDLWGRYCYVPLDYRNPDTIERVVREFEVTIAAGSARKPNLERDQVNLDQAGQTLIPVFDREYQTTGDPTPFNAYMRMWAASRQMDATDLMLPDRRAEVAAQQQAAMQPQQPMPVDPATGQPIDPSMQPVPQQPALMPA